MRSDLRVELLRRAEQDQVARAEVLRRAEQDQVARAEPGPDWDTVASVDADNLTWLKDVVAEIGWPGRSIVGQDGAHAAWLPAQHADREPAFQRRCLDLITEAAKSGEASLTELAYLTDRVLLAEGRPQEYGTQMTGREEGWVPRRLRDPATVDERRAAMSLGPLSEYIARMAHEHGPPRPATLTCAECGASVEVWLPDEGEARHIRCAACGWTMILTVHAGAEPPDAAASH
jgi:DNA-directed RNA polymerase subunit RPC12/RpoP